MYKDKYEINVLVNGRPIREYYHDGKFYVEARQGCHYSIKLKNHSHKRIMAVFSVDGIDVIKGGLASDAESGYIIDPYSHIVINGYRIDDNNVATFKFDDGKTSYSTQVEYKFNKKDLQKVKQGVLAPSKNNGVIGVRIWEEKSPKYIKSWKRKEKKSKFYGHANSSNNPGFYFNSPAITGCAGGLISAIGSGSSPVYLSGCCSIKNFSINSPRLLSSSGGGSSMRSRVDVNQMGELAAIDNVNLGGQVSYSASVGSNAAYTVSNSADEGFIPNYTPNFNVGTSWGKQEEDKVIKVKFEKADTYIDLELYYLERVELVKLGIDLENHKRVFISGYPKAFDGGEEYCKEPVGWRKQ